jgi:hypothetical protein
MDGQLSDKKRAALRGHLEECEGCRSYKENLKILQAEAGKFREVAVRAGFMEALSKRLEESLCSSPAAGSAKTIRLSRRWKWVWVGAAVFVLALAGGTILLFMPKTPPDLWPVSYEDSLARILGEIGEDADLAESFDQVLQASIGEALLQAENPTFWEGLGEDEIRLMELDITNGREI